LWGGLRTLEPREMNRERPNGKTALQEQSRPLFDLTTSRAGYATSASARHQDDPTAPLDHATSPNSGAGKRADLCVASCVDGDRERADEHQEQNPPAIGREPRNPLPPPLHPEQGDCQRVEQPCQIHKRCGTNRDYAEPDVAHTPMLRERREASGHRHVRAADANASPCGKLVACWATITAVCGDGGDRLGGCLHWSSWRCRCMCWRRA
jgi:hypothetical protein